MEAPYDCKLREALDTTKEKQDEEKRPCHSSKRIALYNDKTQQRTPHINGNHD